MGFAEIPREIVVTADVLRALSLVLSFMPGQKESTKKSGVVVRDARASLKILRSRRGRSSVYQIYGSKIAMLAYLFN